MRLSAPRLSNQIVNSPKMQIYNQPPTVFLSVTRGRGGDGERETELTREPLTLFSTSSRFVSSAVFATVRNIRKFYLSVYLQPTVHDSCHLHIQPLAVGKLPLLSTLRTLSLSNHPDIRHTYKEIVPFFYNNFNAIIIGILNKYLLSLFRKN